MSSDRKDVPLDVGVRHGAKDRMTSEKGQTVKTTRNEQTVPGSIRPRIAVEDLMQGTNEIIIEHRGEEYRLRVTSNSKLILTK